MLICTKEGLISYLYQIFAEVSLHCVIKDDKSKLVFLFNMIVTFQLKLSN